MEPIIRWAGSKRQLIGKLGAFWRDPNARYIEPFCGSACLFFNLEPTRAILGDLNSELISTYRALKIDAGLVCECLRRLPTGEEEYYRIRSNKPNHLSLPEIAARFLYLNRNCFNGIYRTNQKGDFNVPYGPPRSNAGFNFERIIAAASLLQNVELLSSDFAATLDKVERGDFVYLDPPYAVARRRIFTAYHPKTFNTDDLARLSAKLTEIHNKGATFVVSYADSREARILLEKWRPKRVRTRRHVAGFSGSRRSAYELMASNMEDFTHAN